jgi:tetratricopeptide (TPR) repeat protein
MFGRGSDRIAEAARLMAAAVALVADPTLLSALKAGTGAYDALKKLLAEAPPGVARLADDLGAEARARFEATHDLPPDAAELYAQMVEVGILAAPNIVAAGMNAEGVTAAMIAKLTDPAHRSGPMLALFRAVTVPVLRRALADNRFADDLRAAFMSEVLRRLGDLTARLDHVDRLTRLEMTALGDRFEIAGMYAMTDAQLREALEKKAEEWRDYRARIEAIDERTAGLGNLKAAARDAAARLDFDEVEELLARVDVVETEIAAETKDLRAQNALLRGRVDEAYRCLSAAADGFGSLSPIVASVRRVNYSARLYEHGLRHGGAGLESSERLLRRALEDFSETRTPDEWANAQMRLGNALAVRGEREGGQSGEQLLRDAAVAYSAVLRVWTETVYPLDWAKTQVCLGNVKRLLGQRPGIWDGMALLRDAIEAYHAALRVQSESAHPIDWAMTQMNLGNSLASQGERLAGVAGEARLVEAAEAFRASLRIRTETEVPTDWAITQMNLGNTLTALGERLGGQAGTKILDEGITAYRAALRVWSASENPVDLAVTQYNLAQTLVSRGRRIGGPEGRGLLGEAVGAFRAALDVSSETMHPMLWASTQMGLANALAAQGLQVGGEAGATLHNQAVEAYREALRVRTEEAHPVQWALTQMNLGNVLAALGEHRGGVAGAVLLEEAVAAYRAALRVRTETSFPADWALTNYNLGLALEGLSHNDTYGDPCMTLREAETCVAHALRVIDALPGSNKRELASAALARMRERLGRECA